MPDETMTNGLIASRITEFVGPGKLVPLFRFEDLDVIRRYSTDIRYIDITFDVYDSLTGHNTCTVSLRINFANYKFDSVRAEKQVPFSRYHEFGGYSGSQYIGFFSDLTNMNSEAYHHFSGRGRPYFLGVPSVGVYEITRDLYDHTFSSDREAILRVPNARNTKTTYNNDAVWESEETTWFSNPISGEYVLVSNRIVPIIFLTGFNIACKPVYNSIYWQLNRNIKNMVYKNILHAVGGTGIISNKLPYSEGRYYTCFRNVIITENNVFHEKDVEFVNKRATAKDSFAALIGLLEFYYQLQLVTH